MSDGYGNARIHKYTPDGKLLMSWGEPGTDPGQFNLAAQHRCDPDGWVYVADRENHRVQVFDGNGKFETQWHNLHRPNGMCMAAARTRCSTSAKSGPHGEINRDWPNIGPRVSIHSHEGKVLARLGKMHAGLNPGQFTSPHGIAVDGSGNVYVGELSGRSWGRSRKTRSQPACASSTSSSRQQFRARGKPDLEPDQSSGISLSALGGGEGRGEAGGARARSSGAAHRRSPSKGLATGLGRAGF